MQQKKIAACLLACSVFWSPVATAALEAKPPAMAVPYQNPVLPGFYSDPSICRVGSDYYMVHSSFGYFPGVPIFHSKNLVNWEQIGHVLTTPRQAPLEKAGVGLGIFAPTLRYHDGTYYLITTNVTSKGNFFVTAKDPRGPWSDPVWVDIPGIDPSLLFDDDGRVWVTSSVNWGKNIHEGIHLAQIDPHNGKLLSVPRNIWAGTGGRYPEGPHIYKKDGWYYLMIAEGATQFGHKVTIARSTHVDGPFEANPGNPILTHANMNAETSPFQGVGHGDMVQTEDGAWFILAHAFRVNDEHQILGRETVLAPVQWDKHAWPVVNGDGTVSANMVAPSLPAPVRQQNYARHDAFDGPQLGFAWNYLHNPVAANYSMTQRPGYLRLRGAEANLGKPDNLTFIGRRQQHFNFEASTELEFNPQAAQQVAGLTLFKDGSHHYQLSIQFEGARRVLVLSYDLGKIHQEAQRADLVPGAVKLRVSGDKDTYVFSYAQGGSNWQELGQADTRYLSSVTAGGFTGVYIGLYASAKSAPAAPADFDWFDYRPRGE